MKAILSTLLLCVSTLIAQAQPSAEKFIAGRVLLENGRPVAGAKIEAYPVGVRGGLHSTISDESGNFKLSLSAAGTYKLEAGAPGFVPDDATNLCRAGQKVTLRLVKGGVITGRVTEITGEPLVGIGVSLYRVRDASGNRLSHAAVVDVQTDDRGIYRAFGLQPGAYIVGAEIRDGGDGSGRNVPTWHPSTTRAAAVEITVHAGAEIADIDIRHRGETGHAISGTVTGDVDFSPPFRGIALTLVSAATKEPIVAGGAGESGIFTFFGIADGEYELYAKSFVEGGFGSGSPLRRVTVKGADVTGLALKLVRFGTLSGRVAIERAPGKCESNNSVEEILLRARGEGRNPASLNSLAAENDAPTAAPDAKGNFRLKALEADGYRLEINLPSDAWYVRAVTQSVAGTSRRTDAARAPINLKPGENLGGLEITIAEGAAGLSGKVVAAREGQRARIHLIPAEVADAENLLRYAETSAEPDGAFQFKHLAPGKYWLLARPAAEAENQLPMAFDAAERAKLRREAEAQKNEITLSPCQRTKDATVKLDLK